MSVIKNKVSRDEIMDNESEGIDTIYMEFINMKNIENAIFCFFEGVDDFHYYKRHIEKYINNEIEIIDKDCGGKDNVLQIYKRIKSSTRKKRQILYFIDRDFEREEELKYNNDIFVTTAYSIENYYITDNAFMDFLKLYLKLNKRCCGIDYDSVFHYYISEREKFINQTLTINAWYSLQTKYKDVKLNQIKKLPKRHMNNIDKLMEMVPNSKDVLEDMEKEKEYLMKNPVMNFRGKYFMEFLHKVLKNIKQYSNGHSRIFSKNRSFSLDFNEKQLVIIFSNCAEPDPYIGSYLKKNLYEINKEVAVYAE